MLSYHRTLCYHSLKSHKIYNMSEQKPKIIDPAITEARQLEELKTVADAARFGGGGGVLIQKLSPGESEPPAPLTPEEINDAADLIQRIEAARNIGGI